MTTKIAHSMLSPNNSVTMTNHHSFRKVGGCINIGCNTREISPVLFVLIKPKEIMYISWNFAPGDIE